MNVNIHVEDNYKPQPIPQQQQQQPVYPQVQPVNFTVNPEQPLPSREGRVSYEPITEPSAYPSVAVNPVRPQVAGLENQAVFTRDIDLQQDFAKDMQIQDLETKNKFLNLLLTVYQSNPIYINSCVICNAQLLMQMIKLLTKCDRVDLVLNDDIACNSCCSDDKLIYVSKILVVNGDESKELKYGYNDVYSKLISYGINLKVVC